jgi:ParB/RepB/Spo0J family partition protein
MAKHSSASALQPSPHKVQEINIDDIMVRARLRSLNPAKVEEQIESIARQGFTDPIEVRIATKWGNTDEKEIVLVVGRHRLEAMKKMGATTISFVLPDDRRKAEMREISENLHHAPLTALEEAEHIANWVELASEEDEIKGHNVPKSRPGRPKGVIAKAAGTLPVKAKTEPAAQKAVRRAIDIAEISPKAKEMAKKNGLDQKYTALLKIAAQKTAEAQLKKLRELVSGGSGQSLERASALSASDKKLYKRLINAWKKHLGTFFAKASAKVRKKFLAEIRRASSSDVGQGGPAKEGPAKEGPAKKGPAKKGA